ncbi:MAG: YhcH/YjgK/YiaL family protein [Sphaerochaeta sp.]|jgi:hypothetical protein|nr:DUF386 domain-containing protein [Spirochaetales bacterium]
MIYDRVQEIGRYESLSPLVSAIQAYLLGERNLPEGVIRRPGDGQSQSFTGSLVAQRQRMLLHYVQEGSEVIAVGYSEEAKARSGNGGEEILLTESQATTVITLTSGMFVLLMPGEPYGLALSGSSEGFVSESLLFE